MSEINFEYFDPEVELCTFDEQGRPIRPRKKPGRKPNPPTPAQRKAQNRAAQRAFRERKRREMRDNEVNIKKCLHQRDQAIRKANTLQRTIKQLRYENNYLKGHLLTMKLACFSHGINVPKFWNTGETDQVGADILSTSKTEGIPQCLEIFLDNEMHIISESPEFLSTTDPVTKTNKAATSSTATNTGAWMHGYQPPEPSSSNIPSRTKSASPTTFKDNTLTSSSYTNDSTGLLAYQQQLLQDTQFRLDPSLYSPVIMPDFITQSLSSQPSQDILSLLNLSPKSIAGSSYWPTNQSIDPSAPGTSTSVTKLSKQTFPPMPAIDAINYLRRKNRDRPFEESVYTPTELQKAVPHDARIDSVPGPLIRDHMIMFQGYYNADTLFSFLIKQSHFLGGDLGNSDHWYVPPSFFQTYWFLMPNHRPRRADNAIEIAVTQGQTLSRMMFQRKKMYLERERFADYFPPLHWIHPAEEEEDDDEESGQSDGDPWETTLDDEAVRADDIPLDMVRTMMDTLPKLSHHGFSFGSPI